jgi:hypothetical protein
MTSPSRAAQQQFWIEVCVPEVGIRENDEMAHQGKNSRFRMPAQATDGAVYHRKSTIACFYLLFVYLSPMKRRHAKVSVTKDGTL